MTSTPQPITIHELRPEGVRPIAVFADGGEAWQAVEEIQAPVAVSQPPGCTFVVAAHG
ncbi:MAG TPA: hypothetical protein VHX88_10145 [Solirubrobacteraceae bacterium]|jgi:hypothetical protein|nr:hypothetical protein [Solirubrobacteraceae bacterium]